MVPYFFVTVVAPAVADVGHIAPVKNTGIDASRIVFTVQRIKIYVPENAAVKFGNGLHGRRVIGLKSKGFWW